VKVDEFADRMEEFKQFDRRLRLMASEDIGQDKKIPLGIGGSNSIQISLKELINKDQETLVSGIHKSLTQLNEDANEREQSFNELLIFLREQKSIIAAKPSIWPVRGWVTSEFGRRLSPFGSEPEFHKGIDIATRTGQPVHAPADGIVAEVGYRHDLGQMVRIHHGHGMTTVYGHLSRTAVRVGSTVRRGDRIGQVGNTGRSTGSHLHYAVMLNGVEVNPRKYLN